MPHKKDYYQSTIPESIQIEDRTYITLELLNQARRDYMASRELINLLNKTKRRTAYQRLAPTNSKYTFDDAVYCAAHTLEDIMQKYKVKQNRAYQLKRYLTARFGIANPAK